MNLSILLQAEGQSSYGTLIMFGLVAVVFYFFMIRPQAKKAKKTKTFRQSLNKGDRIITIGGIHGRVNEVKETNIVIEVESGQKVRIEKSAISMEYTTGSGESELNQQNKN